MAMDRMEKHGNLKQDARGLRHVIEIVRDFYHVVCKEAHRVTVGFRREFHDAAGELQVDVWIPLRQLQMRGNGIQSAFTKRVAHAAMQGKIIGRAEAFYPVSEGELRFWHVLQMESAGKCRSLDATSRG